MRKRTILPQIALFLFVFGAFMQQAAAQAAGTKPELIMYRYNSNFNGPTPVMAGDTIGTLRFKALTSLGYSPTGAAVRSYVTGPVSQGYLPSDLVFMTGAPTLQHRMVVTSSGLVGIGTMTPQYHLHVIGNTHTTGDFFGRIHFDKNVSTDDAPNTYIDEAYFELKKRAILGVPTSGPVGADGGVLTMAPGGTSFDHQLFMGDDGLFTRRKIGNSADWSGVNWHKLLTGEDINGTKNRIAKFTGPNSLGDSQLWDDGAQVGIGTTTPTAGFLFDVNGSARVAQNLNAVGSASVGTTLSVTGAATFASSVSVSDRVGINTAPNLSYRLDVGGDVQADRIAIGADVSGAHKLSVGGSIVAEEVKVALQMNWPDYVFDAPTPDPLEWAKFIETNKHLPGIPSAASIEANGGFNLGETQQLLLEKIEQLTLMIIEQQKQIETLKNEVKQR